ncbi:MAG: phosphate ABC transporter permease subunit PstC [Candidatus Saccharimonadales bacterium]
MAVSKLANYKSRVGLTYKPTLRVDDILRYALQVSAGLLLMGVVYFFISLVIAAIPALSHMGITDFIFKNNWDIARNIFGAWPLVVGTVITSGIALIIGLPVAVSAALFVTEIAPARIRGILALLLDLLAAIPSVVYGLWGVFVLIPWLLPVEKWVSKTFAFLPFIGGQVKGPNYFIAGLILAIMIVPIISAVSREVLATVPISEKEAALALGATRWEMIRLAVLPHANKGIISASFLGLGRAIGETIAVTLVIGNAPRIGHHIFDQGYTLAAVIANEFGEASPSSLHVSALFAAGLVLFSLTLLINAVAHGLVFRNYSDRPAFNEGIAG